ncbi:MAG: ribonuclease E/G [Lachnospiraceae bacterium]|nr:ribonuclease E/G [Lachnospiraceae bacterium]
MMSDIRFVLTRYQTGILAYSINTQSNRLETVRYYKNTSEKESLLSSKDDNNIINIGDIFVAKVMNIVGSIKATFIDYQKGKHGYLPIDAISNPVLLNRSFDGRLKAGDEILVQLEKEAVRSKEPVFTSNLSIAGKYCVVTSGNRSKGVSKKCSKPVREQLLNAIPDDINYGVVIRTNAEELITEDSNSLALLDKECRFLSKQMDSLLNEGIHRTCYSRVWQSPPPYLTMLRDIRNITFSQIITDDNELYDELSAFLKFASPDMLEKLKLYTDNSYPLNKLYCIETKLKELLSTKVWLKSGAYLVIEKTEAMYVIDVNSGKNISKKSNADYILAINLEAAKEIMYQLRLRNLTGMILVDFINMEHTADKEKLLAQLRHDARQDMVKTTIIDMTALELVEITRQKNQKSLAEQFFIS